jgi:uncharacterized protein
LLLLLGTKDKKGFQAQIITESGEYVASSPAVEVNKWNHLAIVINASSKTLSTYINGESAGEANNVEVELEQLFDNNSAENNKLYIGKSLDNNFLNAKLHDFRIYRIPLNRIQIARIHGNALRGEEPVVRTRDTDRSLPRFPETIPQLYNSYLTRVRDIKVETEVGHLPRLPRFLNGVYSNKIEGPKVRVLWPAPEDNSEVLSPVNIQ